MSHLLSDKKNLQCSKYFKNTCNIDLTSLLLKFESLFVVHRRNNIDKACSYILGLLKCDKDHTNMERMVEQVPELAYHQYHNFLSESKWSSQDVNNTTALETSALMANCKLKSGKPVGCLIDESSHLKKGKESVGVARQYAGTTGKVDNCQVAVYSSLCNEDHVSIMGAKLFLPKQWIDDKARCVKAGIPETERVFKTKPQLALEMIKSHIKLGVQFDWIGGDGLYGDNSEFINGLDDEGLFYVIDAHKDAMVYLEEPLLSLPEKTSNKGKPFKNLRPDKLASRIDNYCNSLTDRDYEEVVVRKTTKGLKKVRIHTVAVWQWDEKVNVIRPRTLVITRTSDSSKRLKFSFSNGKIDEYTKAQYAYFQCSRYWVERSFDDAKNELGLSGYQVRKWNAWQHHQSLTMMACLYMLNLKVARRPEYELMSIRDMRIMIIANIFADEKTASMLHDQMLIRHKNRQKDINRHYKKDKDS
jgi:SRSO17 transposase